MTDSPRSSLTNDLRARLRRLGMTRAADVKPHLAPPAAGDIDTLTTGKITETDAGSCFVIRELFPADHLHGLHPLAAWLEVPGEALADLAGDRSLVDYPPESYLFLDTETTGLAGAAAFAFEVGVGFFNSEGQFEIRQFFLRDPSEEPAMLLLLKEIVGRYQALVTFNGRNFDVPLLADRYIMNRQRASLTALPHLDLLPLARRLWKQRLTSCALGSLEREVLGVVRSEDDVSGALIPYLYQQYLRTRDARQMIRVLYHNRLDLFSMIGLGVQLSAIFASPEMPGLPIEDRLSLARWYESRLLYEPGMRAYRLALEEAPEAASRREALWKLGSLYKRLERREEALGLWLELAELGVDTTGHEEIAKHHEWHTGDLDQALAWTQKGIALASRWRSVLRREAALAALHHRQERLMRKLAGKEDRSAE